MTQHGDTLAILHFPEPYFTRRARGGDEEVVRADEDEGDEASMASESHHEASEVNVPHLHQCIVCSGNGVTSSLVED